jgi:hypothetical protein
LERCNNWSYVFDEFVLTCSRFSWNTTMPRLTRAHKQLQRRTALTLLSWTTQFNPRLGSICVLTRPERNIWEDFTSCQMMKMWFRQQNVQFYRDGINETTWILAEGCGP